MNQPQHCGHYVRVGLATFFTCVAAWETLQNGFPGHACVALVVSCGDVCRRRGH